MCGRAAAQSAGGCGPFGNPPATILGADKPNCGDGELLGPWQDRDGIDRYACLYEPGPARAARRLPLLVYLHPSLFPPNSIVHTNLLAFAATFSISGDRKRPGFIVLAPQGRRTVHYYPWPDNRSIGWDNWYRQFSPSGAVKIGETVYPENPDAATIDHFIAEIARAGKVDTGRIYVTGWSNGAAMGLLYALNRSDVAAVAVYSGPDPFGALEDPCRQTPVSNAPASNSEVRIYNPRVPVMHLHNSCDVAGICPNGEQLATELRLAGVNLEDLILDSSGARARACDASCGTDPAGDASLLHNFRGSTVGLHRHERWPSGWTPAVLDFFRRHPLRPAAAPF